jgi:putative transposase
VELELAPQVKQALMGRWEPICRSQLHYLVTWYTRGRRPVLKQRHLDALQQLVRQVCDERDYTLVDVSAQDDHVHILVALRPTQSISSVVRELKGRTGMALISQYPELRVWLRGQLVWDERYAVETVSPLRIERLRQRMSARHRTLFEAESPEGWAAAS